MRKIIANYRSFFEKICTKTAKIENCILNPAKGFLQNMKTDPWELFYKIDVKNGQEPKTYFYQCTAGENMISQQITVSQKPIGKSKTKKQKTIFKKK